MKKVIFFFSQPLEKFNYDRFGFEYFKENGFTPVYIDLSGFFKKKNDPTNFKINKINYKKINNYKNFFIYALNIIKEKPYFFDFTSYKNFFFLAIQYLLTIFGAKKIYASSSLVTTDHLLTPFEKMKILVSNLQIKKILFSILNFIKNKLYSYLEIRPHLIFISGFNEMKKFSNNKNLFFSSSFDYNKYLKIKKKYKKFFQKTFVYLDQNLLFHREFKITNEKKYNKAFFLDYYFKLNNFFLSLSRQYNCKIVFCLHPRCKKKEEFFFKNFFNKKFISFSQKTESEISKSDLVIFNYSNSHQLGVLFRKPMIIVHNLTNKYYDYELKKKIITTISNNLDIEIFNLNDHKKKIAIPNKINKKKYKDYIFKYISTCYPKKINSWDIVINTLKKLNDFKK